ncbi:hypothetical protein Mgra_00008558 [Meloidogyne graminicola]|uniref:Uncharacterized protein n=1 Tax=Meloidogyne graminicola TaxID=189291 RepID=A0A8S9ZFF1_9BILA|nr:hypothetical protein Mgra_00008558 [Meloidogyne graminicola]
MLRKQKFTFVFLIYVFQVYYSNAIKRNVEEENKLFIDKVLSLKPLVEEQVEKSRDIIWNSFSQDVCQQLFIVKESKKSIIIEDLSENKLKRKSADIGAIKYFVEVRKLNRNLEGKMLKEINSMPEAFGELDNLIFTKEIFLTGLNSEDYKKLEKELEDGKKSVIRFIKVIKYQLNSVTEKTENMDKHVKNFIKKFNFCHKFFEILEQMKNLLKTISVIEYNVLYKLNKTQIENFVELYILRTEIIPDYFKKFKFENREFKKQEEILIEDARRFRETWNKLMNKENHTPGQTGYAGTLKYSEEIIRKSIQEMYAILKLSCICVCILKLYNAKILAIINDILQAYEILNIHYNFSPYFTNHLQNDNFKILDEVREKSNKFKMNDLQHISQNDGTI